MKIYTKTGDQGKTSLVGGQRLSKNDLQINAFGNVDELNAWIGLVRDGLSENLRSEELVRLFTNIQDSLFIIGSNLATKSGDSRFSLPKIKPAAIEMLEIKIDEMQKTLPKMTHFILPGGHPYISSIHVARTVCRRAERTVVGLFESFEFDQNILIFLNRLSDFLFVYSRYMHQQLNIEEIRWIAEKE